MIKTPLVIKKALSYFPTSLPVGMTHYNSWLSSVVELIGPIATEEDLRFCVSAEVIRLGPNVCSISKNHLIRRVRAGAAKQIAGAVFTEIKEKQRVAQEAAQKAAADTATKSSGSSGEATTN